MLNSDLESTLKRLKEMQPLIPEAMKAVLDATRPISEALKLIEPIQKLFQISLHDIRNNPEFNFLRLVENQSFTTEEIAKGLGIVENNLTPLLEKLKLEHLWVGGNFALNTPVEQNPDRVRHFFISVRTLIEYMIDTLLAPDEKVKAWEKFKEQSDIYLQKNPISNSTKIPRSIRIKFFSSKIEFGILEEFTEKEIKFIIDLYKDVCRIHAPKIDFSKDQLDLLKLRAGTTIWLLAKLYFIIEEEL